MSTLLTEHAAQVAHQRRPSHVRHEWLTHLPLLRTRRAQPGKDDAGSLQTRRRPAEGEWGEPTFDLFRDAAWAAARREGTR
jgi:hypothetical protein